MAWLEHGNGIARIISSRILSLYFLTLPPFLADSFGIIVYILSAVGN